MQTRVPLIAFDPPQNMYEIDFLPVGDGSRSGDAIALHFTHPTEDRQVVAIIDAGFKTTGEALVGHVKKHYGTSKVDLAILTHPDGDHIGGMGEVVRGLDVERLWLHDLQAHGGGALAAAAAVNDLKGVAALRGTKVETVWAGQEWFGGALRILGPTKQYYDELVQEQLVAERSGAKAAVRSGGSVLLEAARGVFDRIAGALGAEVPLLPGDVNARNNSSILTRWKFDDNLALLTGDAGVPALDQAWDVAERYGEAQQPMLIQIPHHGSRRNCSSAWLDRVIGPIGGAGKTAFISVVKDSDDHPSARVVNAYKRRGYDVCVTAGNGIYNHSPGTPMRDGWGPVQPLGPMDESGED